MAERDSSEMDYEEIIATKFTKKWLNIYYPTVSANYFQICQIFISSLMVCSLAQEKIVSSESHPVLPTFKLSCQDISTCITG